MANENNNFDKLKENSDTITQITEQYESAIGGGSWAGFKEKAKNAGRKVKEFFTGTSSEIGAGATMNANVAETGPAQSAVEEMAPKPVSSPTPGNRRRR